MIGAIIPKLPMRNNQNTREYYVNRLGFSVLGDYGDYLLLGKDNLEIHFFLFEALEPNENYGQVYIRCSDIERLYHTLIENETSIHPNGHLNTKPWGQMEFSLLDPDNNLLTFGQDA